MTARSGGIVFLVSLLIAGCGYSIVRRGEINEGAAARIERGLAKLRGLDFRAPVPMEVKSAEELQAFLRRQLEHDYPPEEIRALQKIYQRLGLLAPGVDLGEALLKLYGAQVAGFYDPHAGKLFLVPSGIPSPGWMLNALQFVLRRDLVNEMLLAHELTHALQDQNFGILAAADDPSNDDRSLAAHAVIEGDATLAGFAYVLGGLPEASLQGLVGRLGAIPAEVEATLPDTPAVLRESLVFQYAAGANFVAIAYLHGGWKAVDALLAHPPASTEQILWPDKYFTHPDSPTEIRFGGLDDYGSNAEWSLLEENTLGALTVRILVDGFLGTARAEAVAYGWDGDRLIAFGRGGDLHLYWMSIWDSPREAGRFFSAESEILARKYPSSRATTEAERITAEGDDPYWLERRGDKVLVALGAAPSKINARIERVWSKSLFAPARIQQDLDLAAICRSASTTSENSRLRRCELGPRA